MHPGRHMVTALASQPTGFGACRGRPFFDVNAGDFYPSTQNMDVPFYLLLPSQKRDGQTTTERKVSLWIFVVFVAISSLRFQFEQLSTLTSHSAPERAAWNSIQFDHRFPAVIGITSQPLTARINHKIQSLQRNLPDQRRAIIWDFAYFHHAVSILDG